MLQSEIAEKIAREAHKGQYRKMGADKGKDYIVHPERVASKFPQNDYLKAAALLHDTIEDSSITKEDLKKLGIEDGVISVVDSLTRRKGETYLDFILRISEDCDAIPVKIADINDNMESLEEGSLKDKYRLALYILEQASRTNVLER